MIDTASISINGDCFSCLLSQTYLSVTDFIENCATPKRIKSFLLIKSTTECVLLVGLVGITNVNIFGKN